MDSGNGTRGAVELLRGQGMRMTPQRLAIVDEIMSTSGYVIPTTVIERVQARIPGVSPSTVYRTSSGSSRSACSPTSTWSRGWATTGWRRPSTPT